MLLSLYGLYTPRGDVVRLQTFSISIQKVWHSAFAKLRTQDRISGPEFYPTKYPQRDTALAAQYLHEPLAELRKDSCQGGRDGIRFLLTYVAQRK